MRKLTSLLCAFALAAGLALPARAARPDTVAVCFHNEGTMSYEPETASEVVGVFWTGSLWSWIRRR